ELFAGEDVLLEPGDRLIATINISAQYLRLVGVKCAEYDAVSHIKHDVASFCVELASGLPQLKLLGWGALAIICCHCCICSAHQYQRCASITSKACVVRIVCSQLLANCQCGLEVLQRLIKFASLAPGFAALVVRICQVAAGQRIARIDLVQCL